MNLPRELNNIVKHYRTTLQQRIEERVEEIAANTIDHLEVYRILGYDLEEGKKIDLYQNIGRFLYRYAGSLLEDATTLVIQETKGGQPIRIKNTVSSSPREFTVDSYVQADNRAHEVKWRDATTDGDHVRKELNKIDAIVAHGMIPVRVMFYMPNRRQARDIQERMNAAYRSKGEAFIGKDAWNYVRAYTGFDLYNFLFSKEAAPGNSG